VPAAAAIGLPVLWFAGLAILAAIPALDRPELQSGHVASEASRLP
jgi:hypothetical protein